MLNGQQIYKINTFIHCDSLFVIYGTHCSVCDLLYVGCALRKLKSRITEHFSNIDKGFINFIKQHGKNTQFFAYFGLEKMSRPVRVDIGDGVYSTGKPFGSLDPVFRHQT